jgi:hypothetical protein
VGRGKRKNSQQTENKLDIALLENNYNHLLFIEVFGRIRRSREFTEWKIFGSVGGYVNG